MVCGLGKVGGVTPGQKAERADIFKCLAIVPSATPPLCSERKGGSGKEVSIGKEGL